MNGWHPLGRTCHIVFSGLLLGALMGCDHGGPAAQHDPPAPVREGPWSLTLALGNRSLPASFSVVHGKGPLHLILENGEERIVVEDVVLKGDSILVQLPLFETRLRGVLMGDSVIQGEWANTIKGPDYIIPFRAQAGRMPSFGEVGSSTLDLAGNWKTTFSPGDTSNAYPAIGLFERTGDRLRGTFLTETGDYRYLVGAVDGDSLRLSCFDGSHAFLFLARMKDDSLHGRFWSGTHWQEPWVAVRDDAFTLRDPDSLTTLKEGHDMVEFSFPGIDGGDVSTQDHRFRNRVLLVQVMGSWCPNCVDEARLLSEFHRKYHASGLDVVALACERKTREEAIPHLRRWRDKLGVPYEIAYVGNVTNKGEAHRKLPFLDRLMSYPTCIAIDRSGVVRRIHTGFSGPGTGEHYRRYKTELEGMIRELLDGSTEVALRSP